ncbi:hypothetical protein JW905_14865 [bacterium]|nr:hypothetical protein [candidate division CSSED10-310 bacterium]
MHAFTRALTARIILLVPGSAAATQSIVAGTALRNNKEEPVLVPAGGDTGYLRTIHHRPYYDELSILPFTYE